MSNSSLVLRLRSAFNGARDASLAGLLLLGPAAAQAASLTVKNFDEDLATVYVNGATMTEVNGVACYTWTNTSTPGTLTIPAGGAGFDVLVVGGGGGSSGYGNNWASCDGTRGGSGVVILLALTHAASCWLSV